MWEERPARVRVDIEVRAWPAADHQAVVRDISLSGCLLITAAPLKQTQELLLAIPLAGGSELRLACTVVRWHDDREGGGYGVRFDPMADEQQRALGRIVVGGRSRPRRV